MVSLDRMKALDEDFSKLLLTILFVEKETPKKLPLLYKDFQESFFVSRILQKRIDVFHLPTIEPGAIMTLTVLANNPGKGILALIETYEKADKLRPEKINAEFVCIHVYPMGFYADVEFKTAFENRKTNRYGKYDFII